MQLLNTILTGRFASLLTRTFGISGGAPAPTLSPEIQPGFNVYPEDAADLHFGRLDLYCARHRYTAAAPGINSFAALVNPPSSNVLAVVRMWVATLSAPGNLGIYVYNRVTTVPALVRGLALDTRWLNLPNGDTGKTGACGTTGGDWAAPGFNGNQLNPFSLFCLANTMTEVPPVVLSPGSVVAVLQQTVNADILGAFAWTERPMSPLELAR